MREALLTQVAEEVRKPVRKNLFESEDPNLFGTKSDLRKAKGRRDR